MEGLVISDAVKDLIINIINIVILFVIVRSLAYKPVKKFLTDRTERIKKMKSEAEELKTKAEIAEKEYQKLSEESKNKSANIIHQAELSAHTNSQAIIEEAKKNAQAITQKAMEDAEKIKKDALVSMKEDVTEIVIDISKQVLTREVTDEDNLRIADAFFEQLSDN